MDIRPLLEGVGPEAPHARILAEVQRNTRNVPEITLDSHIWHELCEEACQILVYGAKLDRVFSSSVFAGRPAYWCGRLATTTTEEVEQVTERRKKQGGKVKTADTGRGQGQGQTAGLGRGCGRG